MHQRKISTVFFVQQNLKNLYSKCSVSNKKVFSKGVFLVFTLIVIQMEEVNITEQTLNNILQMDELSGGSMFGWRCIA